MNRSSSTEPTRTRSSHRLIIVSTATFGETSIALFKQAAPHAEFYQYPKAAAEDIPPEVLAQAEVYYAYGDPPSDEAAPNLKWVQTNWAGVDSTIEAAIFKTGRVILTSGAGIHAVNMGEYALMMMLALAHRLPRAFAMMQAGTWSDDRAAFMPMELRGATLGLIGYGRIGREIARLAQVFGMHVVAMRNTPTAAQPTDAGGPAVEFISRERLPELLRRADFVVLIVPFTPHTRGMIDARALAHMKPTAYLINIGRGAVVDEGALIAALREGRIAGAALDVFEREPLPDDSPLWRLAAEGRVILTPHIAGQTPHYEARAAALFAENLRRYVGGQPLINQVDFARGY